MQFANSLLHYINVECQGVDDIVTNPCIHSNMLEEIPDAYYWNEEKVAKWIESLGYPYYKVIL